MDCSPTRALQHVVAIRDRAKVVEWMAAQALLHGEKGDWWRKRPAENDDETADSKPLKYARSSAGNRHQFLIKSARGRGPKLGEHSSWLYPTLLTEFERLRKAGVKMSTRLLQVVAIALIEESQHPIFNKAFCFNDREFRGLVTPQRLQDFTDRFNIVYRRLKGKKFFLQTAAECVRRVNAECDKTGANWAKKSMVLCGLDVGADGVWKVEQLGKDLQEIIAEYPDEFRKGYDEAVQSVSLRGTLPEANRI
ncbi:hypothetical protein JG688_00017145 [Phytophthora aleatoria]|uniref:Uncharacterized protein n=1 Tax=Phytophthora aleatoria TaxID=2496075 RepID=A0A8J5M1J0_9STRA|nr:hypothetical protein JG688_00017145 [Phytophthora aleatoria]